jgi:branched-chain amino acid transport system ATP-binding protein
LLQLDDIHTFYGENHVLHGLSLDVKKGSVVALLGRNGMGKTTTIRTIIGFNPPRSGIVRFKAKNLSNLPPFRIAQMGVGLVPQGRHIFPSLSVKENLTMSARNIERIGAWSLGSVYSLFPILKERAKLQANLLSGGEQQMLSIGRALMTNPDLLLMDEPSEGLAILLVREIGDIIVRLKKSDISILLVEQNLPLVLSVVDYVYLLSKGKIVYESTPKELKDNEEVKAMHLGVSAEDSLDRKSKINYRRKSTT